MGSRDFAYWLQGFFEISGDDLQNLDKEKIEMIKRHLNMVFVHEIDPSMGGKEKQNTLNNIHVPPIKPLTNPPFIPSGRLGGPIARC